MRHTIWVRARCLQTWTGSKIQGCQIRLICNRYVRWHSLSPCHPRMSFFKRIEAQQVVIEIVQVRLNGLKREKLPFSSFKMTLLAIYKEQESRMICNTSPVTPGITSIAGSSARARNQFTKRGSLRWLQLECSWYSCLQLEQLLQYWDYFNSD